MQSETFDTLEPLYHVVINNSQTFVQDFGEFLPHGAIMYNDGEVVTVMAGPDHGGEMTNAAELFPNLHEAMRTYTAKPETLAVAVSEAVSISTGTDGMMRTAIKVLIEHRNGEVEAVYQTYEKPPWGKVAFDNVMLVDHAAEVGGWR